LNAASQAPESIDLQRVKLVPLKKDELLGMSHFARIRVTILGEMKRETAATV
jgi:hypothetical protein